MATQTWSWPYISFSVSALLEDDMLTIKQGLRTFEVPLANLRHVYVNKFGEYQELVLAVEKSPGKNKIVRSYSNGNDPSVNQLVDALAAKKPGIDLRGVDKKTAFKTMGAVNTTRYAAIVVIPTIIVVMGLIFLPFLIHGLDKGRARVTVEELSSGRNLDTRNLEVVGLIDEDHQIDETITDKNGTTHHYYAPIVEADWTAEKPIHVVLEGSFDKYDQGYVPCVVRNVMYEGLSGDNKAFFIDHYQLKISPDVILCEVGDGSSDMFAFLMIMGITIPLVLIIGIVVAVRMR